MLSPHTSSSEIKISQLDSYINREEVKINEIYQHSNDLCDDNHSDFEPEGKIWKSFYEENCFFHMTHFTCTELLDLWREIVTHGILCKKRGRKPTVTDMDALIAYLVQMKTGMDLDTLATLLKVHPSSLNRALEKIAPILFQVLKDRWWNNRIRPIPLEGKNFPYIALCADSTSIEINRPKG